jgi:hypothetical protein
VLVGVPLNDGTLSGVTHRAGDLTESVSTAVASLDGDGHRSAVSDSELSVRDPGGAVDTFTTTR